MEVDYYDVLTVDYKLKVKEFLKTLLDSYTVYKENKEPVESDFILDVLEVGNEAYSKETLNYKAQMLTYYFTLANVYDIIIVDDFYKAPKLVSSVLEELYGLGKFKEYLANKDLCVTRLQNIISRIINPGILADLLAVCLFFIEVELPELSCVLLGLAKEQLNILNSFIRG